MPATCKQKVVKNETKMTRNKPIKPHETWFGMKIFVNRLLFKPDADETKRQISPSRNRHNPVKPRRLADGRDIKIKLRFLAGFD
jgi:hypothetical protein